MARFFNWPFWGICLTLFVFGHAGPAETSSSSKELSNTDSLVPKIIKADYIDLSRIASFTKFRSGEGHNYSDAFESCRSMKHYFRPSSETDWAKVKIFSPVKGTVVGIQEEWAGTKVEIRSEEFSACTVAIFHVRLLRPLQPKDKVAPGQQLGFHFGKQTLSDIAVSIDTPRGRKLISYFEVLSDSVFARYQSQGLHSREDAIISKELRDADPLTCIRGEFVTPGKVPNWVGLGEERRR
jgi:hypothetical protein